jgi:hypothetical protein
MRPRLLPAVGLMTALVTACSADDGAARRPGDAVTRDEAGTLAELLHRNVTRGGADFVVTAPYGEDTVLTLTGEVDFRRETGRAQAVTSFGDSRPDDTRTLFFTHEEVWIGGIPGLPEALAAAGRPGATYVHRPLTAGDEGATPPLVDALLEVLLNLAAATPDDPRSFVDAGYTWEGQRSIDSRLTSLFGLKDGRTVAVAAANDLLTQFVTPLAGGLEVTVTLSDHGARTLPVPTPEETAEAADQPEIAAAFGV